MYSQPRPPSRVVILGAGGFVGSSLVTELESQAIEMLPLSSRDLDLARPGADERLAKLLRADDAVVMLAAITPDKDRSISAFMRNLEMGRNLCSALQRASTAHVIYVSSDAVYPMQSDPVTEASPAAPTDLYGAMHRSREIMLETIVPKLLAILRPTMIYGIGDTHKSYGPNRLRNMARNEGRITLFGRGEEHRDYVLIGDVAALIVRVLEQRSVGILNLVSGRSISYADLARELAALFETKIQIENTKRQVPVTHRYFSNAAIVEAFPAFRFTPLYDGLKTVHRQMLQITQGPSAEVHDLIE